MLVRELMFESDWGPRSIPQPTRLTPPPNPIQHKPPPALQFHDLPPELRLLIASHISSWDDHTSFRHTDSTNFNLLTRSKSVQQQFPVPQLVDQLFQCFSTSIGKMFFSFLVREMGYTSSEMENFWWNWRLGFFRGPNPDSLVRLPKDPGHDQESEEPHGPRVTERDEWLQIVYRHNFLITLKQLVHKDANFPRLANLVHTSSAKLLFLVVAQLIFRVRNLLKAERLLKKWGFELWPADENDGGRVIQKQIIQGFYRGGVLPDWHWDFPTGGSAHWMTPVGLAWQYCGTLCSQLVLEELEMMDWNNEDNTPRFEYLLGVSRELRRCSEGLQKAVQLFG